MRIFGQGGVFGGRHNEVIPEHIRRHDPGHTEIDLYVRSAESGEGFDETSGIMSELDRSIRETKRRLSPEAGARILEEEGYERRGTFQD